MSNAYLCQCRMNPRFNLRMCIRSWLDLVVAGVYYFFFSFIHSFILHPCSEYVVFFFGEFVDVFVNMAYRYSSGLTRFKSDIYSFHCTHAFICVSACFFRLFSFLHHAYKYEKIFYFFCFALLCFECLHCFRLPLIYDFFYIHFGSLYLFTIFFCRWLILW